MGGAAVAHFPVRPDWTWQSMAACRGMDTAFFYHPENERGPTRHRRDWEAKRICRRCRVVGPCLQWALETREPYGVWGGMSVEERQAMQSGQRLA
jgi:WhiB family transcriptional regulator, redox-sensing transcriptional regulator